MFVLRPCRIVSALRASVIAPSVAQLDRVNDASIEALSPSVKTLSPRVSSALIKASTAIVVNRVSVV